MTVTRATPIGLVGLGNLGLPICANLSERGWSVNVFDTKPDRLDAARQAGGVPVTLADLPDAARVICFAVPDDVAVRGVLGGGVLDRLTPDHVVVVHSTVLPGRVRGIAEWVTSTSGARYVEAPVSGGAERARRGALTVFLGGDPADIGAVRPLIDDLANQVFHIGALGAGSATKLANQLIAFTALAGVHEALRLTQTFGVADGDALAAIATATGDTWVGRNLSFWDRTAAEYDQTGVPLTDRPWSKDLWEIVTTGREAGLSLPVAALVAQLLPAAVEQRARAAVVRSGG